MKRSSQVIRADCLEGLKRLPDDSVDHTITDPPYESECHDGQRMVGNNGRGEAPTSRVTLGFESMTEDERVEVSSQIVRVTRGWALVFCQDQGAHLWCESLKAAGAKYRRTCIWHKTDAMPKMMGDGPAQGHEPFVVFWCGKGRSKWNAGGRSGVFVFPSGRNKSHPTEKPLALMQELILCFTAPGQLILDPYAGSGTTLVAAKATQRSYLGWEVDEKFHREATRRLEMTAARDSLFGLSSSKLKPEAYGLRRTKLKHLTFGE